MSEQGPLSRRQILFWLGQDRYPGLPLYNMAVAIEIRGAIDPQRFCNAFDAIVASSDELRSVFREADGEVVRDTAPPDRFAALSVVDLSGEADPDDACRALLTARTAVGFDLGSRCFDSTLVKLGEERFVWWFCQHHMLGDGSSVRLLYSAIAARYVDPAATRPAVPAGEPGRQEKAYQASARAQEDDAFWAPRRSRPAERPGFYGRAATESGKQVERIASILDADRVARLRALGARFGNAALPDLGVVVLLQTALLAYVGRVGAGRQPSIGVPVRNRHGRRAREAFGTFMEVLPLQVDLGERETFATLAKKVAEETGEVLRHGQACLSNPETRPLYDVMFNFHAEKYPAFAGLPTKVTFTTGLHALDSSVDVPGSAFVGQSLSLHCHDYADEGQLTLWFDFHAGRFDAGQRARAVGHFLRLLDGALADLDTVVDGVDIVGVEERQTLIGAFNPPRTPVPAATVVEMFDAQAAARARAPAVCFDGQSLSYGALAGRAARLAQQLRQRGAGRDKLVALLLDRSPNLPVALLATLKAGAAYVPLDPAHPARRQALILEATNPTLVLTERAFRDRVQAPPGAEVICLEDLAAEPTATDGPTEPLSTPDPESLAYVIFTSGSTGKPKGVSIPHAALANLLAAMGEAPGITADDRVLAITTITFDIAGLEMFLPLVTGASIELCDGRTAGDPPLLAARISSSRPTIVQATPATWQMMLEAGWGGDPGIKALVGGEALRPELAERLVGKVGELWNVYGPTETTIWSTAGRVDPAHPRDVTVGVPVKNTTVYVLNEALRLAPIGVVGEVFIGGDGLARGYHGGPELTAARFVQPPFEGAGRLYRTGDIGLRRADGRIEVLGRTDAQVKIRGFRIETGEIEALLVGYPGVAAAVVAAREDQGGRKQLVAYLVERPCSAIDYREVRRYLEERLPSYMVPAQFVTLAKLPLTASGKVDHRALPSPTASSLARPSEPPQSDVELQVALCFEKLLGTVPGRRDSFFDLGGDSVLAVQLAAELGRLAESGFDLGAVFEHPTVAELAQTLTVDNRSARPLVLPIGRPQTGPGLFCICGVNLYRELALSLAAAAPVYGVYLPSEEEAIAKARRTGTSLSVVELARDYVEAIRTRQPSGPYSLAGVSFGGLLAFEMAQQLKASGEEVALLALFDTVLPRGIRRRWVRWTMAHLSSLMDSDALVSGLKQLFKARPVALPGIWPRGRTTVADAAQPLLEERIQIYRDATHRYEPLMRPYDGRALLFRATGRNDFAGDEVDPDLGWRGLIAKLDVRTVDGGHIDMLKAPRVATLAAALRPFLSPGDQAAGPVESVVAGSDASLQGTLTC